jgi:hypothetical protein
MTFQKISEVGIKNMKLNDGRSEGLQAQKMQTLRLKRLKMENSFDINNLVRENVKTMKPYSSAS